MPYVQFVVNIECSSPVFLCANIGDMLKLELKDMELEFSWPIGKIKEVIPDFDTPSPSTPLPCSSETLKSIASLYEEQNIPEAKITLASGVSAFLWLYTATQGYVHDIVPTPPIMLLKEDLFLDATNTDEFFLSLCSDIVHGRPLLMLSSLFTNGWFFSYLFFQLILVC